MGSIPVSLTGRYQTLLALREAGFPNWRIYAAMSALYDVPADGGPSPEDWQDHQEAMERCDAQEAVENERRREYERYA